MGRLAGSDSKLDTCRKGMLRVTTPIASQVIEINDYFLHSASKDPVPAWAQLQVKEDDFNELALFVRNAVWEDARGTFNHSTLLGPPYVERAIYKKIPSAKAKKDLKEGTIDEDDEWQKFLISLTQDPDAKKAEAESAAGDSAVSESAPKPQLTPLVAHILENKANKAKEAANAKSRKHTRQDSQGKGKGTATTSEEPKKKSREKSDKPNATVRILKKQAATEAAAEAAKAVAKDIKAGAPTAEGSTGRRRVGGISDILKRDLGLAGPSSRKARQEARQETAAAVAKSNENEVKTKDAKTKANGSSTAASSTSAKPADRSTTPTAPKAPAEKSSRGGRRRGKDAKANEAKAGGSSDAPAPAPAPAKPLVILQKKKEDTAPTTSKDAAPTAKPVANKPAASITSHTPPTGPKAGNAKGNQGSNSQKKANPSGSGSGARRAFLKHANPSQGVTEALLKEAMGAFGSVNSVEIDRRKGFAYVEFTDNNGLVKALAASPVTVANAAVQVLERKDQNSKKAATASTPNIATQPNPPKENNPSAGPSSAATPSTPAGPPAGPPNEKTGESQPAKRSRRRGRGKGGSGGGSGNADGKLADQAGANGPSSSAPPTGGAADTGAG